jgi:hypothetical protein
MTISDLEKAIHKRNEAEHIWLVALEDERRRDKAMYEALKAYQLSNHLHNDSEALLFETAHDVLSEVGKQIKEER